MSYWDSLSERYRVILCDVWGVVHDGVHLYPRAAERLREWRDHGRRVILITNAPRTADAVERQLGRIGLPRDAWDEVATSGASASAAATASTSRGSVTSSTPNLISRVLLDSPPRGPS